MLPSRPVYDFLEGITANAVISLHSVAGRALGVSGSDFSDLVFSEFTGWMLRSFEVFTVPTVCSFQDPYGMEDIFASGDHFKVFQPVVVFDSVDVINHQPVRNGTNKNLVNKPMNFEGFYLRSSSTQGNDIVSVFVYTALDNLPSSAGNPALIGDLIAFPFGEVRPGFVFHSGTIQ